MLRDVKHTVTDNLLGAATNKGTGVHLKIGASPVISADPILITGSMSSERIKAKLGLSPLTDAVLDSVAFGANKIFCVPVAASNAGTVGQVKKTGEGTGTMTVSGTPTNAFDVSVKITGKGGFNTALFKVSIDGGYSYSDDLTVPVAGVYEVPDAGLTLTFKEGGSGETTDSFKVGDTYEFATVAPTMSNEDVLAKLEQLHNFSESFEFVHIVGESSSAMWKAVSTAQNMLRDTYHKPLFFVMEAFAPQKSDTMKVYAEALVAARAGVQNYDLQVVPARGLLVKMDGTTKDVNLAGVVCGLYARTNVQESIGRTAEAAALGIPKSRLLELRPAGIVDVTETLDAAGFLTFREYDGLDKFFVYHAKMLSPEGSDYRYAEDVRVKNKIIRETRKEGLKLLNDDIDLEDIDGELAARAIFMFAPLQQMINNKEISSATIEADTSNSANILTDETMRVRIRYVSKGYIREIEVDLGRSPATN